MDRAQWNTHAKGLAIIAGYGTMYFGLWCISFDQWFLPAALRVTCLLLAPYRLWPYIFLGDAAALLYMRAPKVEAYGVAWAYFSPFLPLPIMSLAAVALRRYIKTIAEQVRWLPVSALVLASAATLSNLAVNYALDGPKAENLLDAFLRFSTGQYLGILTVVPGVLMWMQRKEKHSPLRPLLVDGSLAAFVIGVMYAFVMLSSGSPDALRQMTLLMMILPAAFLTFLHGWRGAVIGVALVNLAVSLMLKHTGVAGAHDSVVFLPQQALAIAATLVLVAGSKITEHYNQARKAGLGEAQALHLAHSSFLSTEPMLREHLVYIAQLQMLFDDERREVVDWLKNNGHPQAALDFNSRGVMHRRIFDARASVLYPIRIESDGLFSVIHAREFSDFLAGDTEVSRSLTGNPRELTIDLQLAAYRCACQAMVLHSECLPSSYRIVMRVWQGSARRGIYMLVSAKPSDPLRVTSAGMTAEALLASRIKAIGGILRRDRYRIAILLSEPLDAVSTPMELAPEV